MDRERVAALIRESALFLLERFERAPEYGCIDTKFDIVTGRDFGPADEDFRQKDFIYGWIQGRGLESLADHAAYFAAAGEPALADRLRRMAERALEHMEELRAANGGRIAFAMTPAGAARYPGTGAAVNYSDLFYSKGLFAAARMLGRPGEAAAAERMFRAALRGLAIGEFRTDQHLFDPKNPATYAPGKQPQGPKMIALSGLARFAAAFPDEAYYPDTAAGFIREILRRHLHPAGGEPFDFVESVAADGSPWRDGAAVICDPGHALEFCGLAGKCLLEMRRQGRHEALLAECGAVLPELFRHTFDLGFQGERGIVKSFDLISRRAANADMPWWSLPETLRAGAELRELYPANSAGIAERCARAEAAFFSGFVAHGTHGFACQTLDAAGRPVRAIPAVPDADPGYHTNLSLIDALKLG